jgi:hypothetical protein
MRLETAHPPDFPARSAGSARAPCLAGGCPVARAWCHGFGALLAAVGVAPCRQRVNCRAAPGQYIAPKGPEMGQSGHSGPVRPAWRFGASPWSGGLPAHGPFDAIPRPRGTEAHSSQPGSTHFQRATFTARQHDVDGAPRAIYTRGGIARTGHRRDTRGPAPANRATRGVTGSPSPTARRRTSTRLPRPRAFSGERHERHRERGPKAWQRPRSGSRRRRSPRSEGRQAAWYAERADCGGGGVLDCQRGSILVGTLLPREARAKTWRSGAPIGVSGALRTARVPAC